MKFRNESCSMGAFSNDHEYEWREASAAKIRQAKQALDHAQRKSHSHS